MTPRDECLQYEELMADLAAGALSAGDEQKLRAHVEGCVACGRALREFREAGIAVAVSKAVEAPPVLRDRLMSRLKKQKSDAFLELNPGILVTYVANLAWKGTPIPGVQRKLLSRDKESGTYTALVHMASGTRYPRHRHAGTEQLFMLSGTLALGDKTIGKGDFCVAHAGTVHAEIRALDDSEFLVVTSEYDEILASDSKG
ncbi:MAG: cupin domain-containing protein [Acidobacteria bacterium]|nr:cupin domain-containing protein [Acidobacteriota bacterium]